MELSKCAGCMNTFQGYPCPKCGYDPQKVKEAEYVLPPETILGGKYLVGRVLGQGGFGITYIGWDIALERKVAIKEYYPSGQVSRAHGTRDLTWYTSEQSQRARYNGMQMFLKEARKMSKVDNISQVVRVRDLFQENETAYIVMDFIEGETLKDRLKKRGPMPWEEAKEIFLPVIQAMEKVHQAGLIHRDISPDNLMMTPDGNVMILDLGAAKDLNINSGASSVQVAKGGFSPLEQYTQRGASGPWTDVYAVATSIYYTLTGVLPPTAVDRIASDSIRWDLDVFQRVPSPVLQALQKAMAVLADVRTRSMLELEKGLMTGQKEGKTAADSTYSNKKKSIPVQGEAVTISQDLSFEEAALGCEKIIPVTVVKYCPTCNGAGIDFFNTQSNCPTCKGKGKVRHNQKINLKIPAGIDNGQMVRCRGMGNVGSDGGERGDMLVTVHVLPHPVFTRNGYDVCSKIHVSEEEARLGKMVAVPTLDGNTTLALPKGVHSGQTVSVEGKGIPHMRNPSLRGKHHFTIIVDKTVADQTNTPIGNCGTASLNNNGKSVLLKAVCGAFLASLLAVLIQFVLANINLVSWGAAIITYLCANAGFRWLGKGNEKVLRLRVWLCVPVALVMTFAGAFLAYSQIVMEAYADAGLKISLYDAGGLLANSQQLADVRNALHEQIGISYGVWGLYAIVEWFIGRHKSKKKTEA